MGQKYQNNTSDAGEHSSPLHTDTIPLSALRQIEAMVRTEVEQGGAFVVLPLDISLVMPAVGADAIRPEIQPYETYLKPEYGQRVLMLSTCNGEGVKEERILIFATETP